MSKPGDAMSYIYTVAVTLLALLPYMGFSMAGAQARWKYAIKAPVPPL